MYKTKIIDEHYFIVLIKDDIDYNKFTFLLDNVLNIDYDLLSIEEDTIHEITINNKHKNIIDYILKNEKINAYYIL
jgi:hypothetical protein